MFFDVMLIPQSCYEYLNLSESAGSIVDICSEINSAPSVAKPILAESGESNARSMSCGHSIA